jgi:hypothetical protein
LALRPAAINAKETMGASMLLGFPDWIVFTSMCIPFGITALIALMQTLSSMDEHGEASYEPPSIGLAHFRHHAAAHGAARAHCRAPCFGRCDVGSSCSQGLALFEFPEQPGLCALGQLRPVGHSRCSS